VRNMDVRAKLLLVLGVVVALFPGALFWMVRGSGTTFAKFTAEQLQEERTAFDSYLERRGEALTSFVTETSGAPRMLTEIRGADRKWMEENITDELLARFGAHVFWVYDKERKLIYSRNTLYTDG